MSDDDTGVASRLGWKQSYSVGIPEIDHQHQTLIDLIHALTLSIGSGEEHEATADTFDAMDRYIKEHFGREEQLMQQAEYAKLEEHQRRHAVFIDELRKLREQLANGSPDVLQQTVNFIGQWFVQHVLEEDIDYVPALRAAGLIERPSS
jgi:hemerythrin-like metal-binding protein